MARCNYWLERDWTFVMMYSSWHQDKSNMLGKSYLLSFSQPRTFPLTIKVSGFSRTNTLKFAQHIRSGMNYEHSTNGMLLHGLKPGLHYQSFCDHRRYFAKVNSKFWRICKKVLRKLSHCLTLSQYPQTFLTNPSKLRIYLCKIPTVITETLTV
jgi:hypothetical protein